MHVVIVGCGRVGADLAAGLADEGHDVVVIDKDPAAFAALGATFNGITIAGTGIDRDVLKRADIEKAEVFAAVTSNDNVNIMAAQVARAVFNVPRVVARANEPGRVDTFHELGIATICPTDLGAAALKSMLVMEGLQAKQVLGAGEVLLAEVVMAEGRPARTVAELEVEGKIRIGAIIRDGTARVAEPGLFCNPGDVLVLSARRDTFDILRNMLEGTETGPRRHPWTFGANPGQPGKRLRKE